jgi:integrase
MASIIKRKYNGKRGTTTKYYISYRDIQGKQHTVGGYIGLEDAKKHLKDYEDGICTKTDITIKDIFDLYFNKLRKKSESTYENCERYYNKYFKKIEHLQYKRVSLVFLQEFFDEIELHSPYVAKDCLKFARASTNNAINKNLISMNKFNKLDKIELPKPDINHLTISELKQILKTAETDPDFKYRDYVCLYTFIGTGMREGEIFGLDVTDVNLDIYGITVNKQFTRGKLKHTPKTASSYRIAYFHEDLAKVLREYIPTVKGSILFPNEIGGYINANNFRKRFWNKLLKKCNINKRVRLHDLRGSYIDMTLSSGLSVKFTQNNVGHARTETTTNIYARNNDDMINNAKEVINNIFCCRNVVEKQKTEKSNIIPFPKKQAI